MRSGKAPGESEVTVDILKLIDDSNLKHMVAIMERWREEAKVPDVLNVALIRLLPKTDKGTADISKCRPIALMEHLTKWYEHIVVGRVSEVVFNKGLLHKSQYGAVSKSGVQGPLRVFAEILDDARSSHQDLHVFTTDLSKAFDTVGFWSEELSWRCLGMPEHLVDIMTNLDAGCAAWHDEHDTGCKEIGATTRMLLGHRAKSAPFQMGRGVRQGSVGGPLKWIVFMNFWLEWVHRECKGEGYVMQNQQGQKKIQECWGGEAHSGHDWMRGGCLPRKWGTEVLGQMFVDDSIWASKSSQGMQKMVIMHEEFCKFHGLQLNREKCAYFAVNAPPADLRWKKDDLDTDGRGDP